MAEPLHKHASNRPGTPLSPVRNAQRIPLVTFGLSLGLFLTITYVLCVSFDLLFPSQAMHPSWQLLLPGFTWLTWPASCSVSLRALRMPGTSP